MTVSHQRIQRMVGIACLGALAFILMMFEFPIIPVASYLKIDFSDIPVLLGGYLYGPLAGVVVAFIKCFLHAMVNGFAIGDLIGVGSDFISSLALLFPFYYVWRHQEWSFKRQALTVIPLATLVLTVVMSLLNLWVITPLYMAVWHWQSSLPVAQLVALGVLPFNIVKGLLLSIVFILIAAHLRQWLQRNRME